MRACVVGLLAGVLLLAACSGPSEQRVAATPTSTAAATTTVAQSAPQPTPAPSATSAPATHTPTQPAPTPTATQPPTPSPTTQPTSTPQPTATPTPDPRPADQALGLPDLAAAYRLDISAVNVESGEVVAAEVITVSDIRGERPQRLYLQVLPAAYGFFTLDGATLAGAPVGLEALNDGYTLALDLPADLATPFEIGLTFRLDVGYESSGWGGTALDGEVLRLGYWFPIISNDHGYSETMDPSYTRVAAAFEVNVTHDPQIVIAHTGTLVAETPLDDGRVRSTYSAEQVRDFAMTMARSYDIDTGTSATGVTIELYSLPSSEDHLSAADAAARRGSIIAWAADAVDQLSGLVGPYPYDTLRLVDSGPSMPGGVEFPQLIYINPNYVPLDRLIYHETAHQWYYGIIGNRTLLDGWIDEGGAEFFERGLPTGFSEQPAIPSGGYVYWLDSSYLELPPSPRLPWYYSIYEQGARFHYAVMEAMGWDQFWAAMQDIYRSFAFGIVTPWDMLTTWQRYSAGDLRPLYHDYFRYEWIDSIPGPGA